MKEFKTLVRFIKPYKLSLFFAILSMISVTAMNLAAPWMIRNLIQSVTGGGSTDYNKITMLAIAVVIIYIMRAFAQFGTNYISHYAAWQFLKDIRRHLYEHIQRLSLRYFEDKQTGDLMSRVVNDTRNFEHLTAHAIPTILVNGCMVVGITTILFSMNVKLALLTLIPIPLLIWAVLKFSRVSRPLFKKAQGKIADLNSILQDNFSGIKEIKAFTQEDYESDRAGSRIKEVTKSLLKALKVSAVFQPSIQFISGFGTVIVIFFGGRLALSGDLPIEDLVAFLLYLSMFYQPITALGRINEGLQRALASAERVIEILNVEPDIRDFPDAVEIKDVKGSIRFENINFRYVKNIPILKKISFDIKPGETVALVGPTGVGKTTIARLIPRFYEADSGDILIDGMNIRNIKVSSLRENISIVSQDIFLFNGTIKENILYGRPEATEDEVISAAAAANAHEFIQNLSNGYETQIGERGIKLSGGQKQRISIARAILKDAPILILDEATSSVDTQTERLIQDALNKLMENKTSVVIAHRLSTIEKADQIIVLKDGFIVESGRHEDLLNAGGLYNALSKAQTLTI